MKLSNAWVLLAVAAIVGVFFLEDACVNNLETCEGLSRTVYEATETYFLIVVGLGVVGWLAIRRFEQDREIADSTRPCPRCGRQIEVGKLDCPHCEFDFRTIGK